MDLQALKRAFAEQWVSAGDGKGEAEPLLFFSPGRINLIGEHIDYNGGLVLPAAIDLGTYAAVRPRTDGVLRLASVNEDLQGEFDVEQIPDRSDENGWMNYPLGVTRALKDAGYKVGGADILISGEIPIASGLSSSASLELLIAEIHNSLFNLGQVPALTKVLISKTCENEYMGLKSGIMDQFAVGMGKAGHAILLDCSTLEYEYLPLELGDKRIFVLNSRKPRKLIASKYNERFAECMEALEILQPYKPIDKLCELKETDLSLLTHLPTELLRRRVRHCIMEQARVEASAGLLRQGKWEEFGHLLNASHASLRDDYEVTGHEMDVLTAAAREFPHCLGARMCGAGFGGTAIALLDGQADVDGFRAHVLGRYLEETGLNGEIFEARADDACRLL